MRILVVEDIHNDIENLMQFIDKVSEFNFDLVVCPGDFTDIAPMGFSQEDIGRIVIEELKSLGKPLLAVPGNQDAALIKVFDEEHINVHGKGKTIGGVGFYGFGGAKTPFKSAYEPDESEIEFGLRSAYEEIKNAKIKVQITHNPPFNTKLDMIPSGNHVGSKVVRALIEEFKPDAAVCAHIHEARGVDEIGRTKIINSGRFPEGYCGLIDITDSGVEAKVVNLI